MRTGVCALLVIAAAGLVAGESWHVANPSLGTIFFGIDTFQPDAGYLAGMSNGPGNQIYRFTDGGDSLELLLPHTDVDQPFMMMAARANSENSSVYSGVGFGTTFPGAMFSADGGASFQPSTTASTEHWGLYHDCSKSLDGSAYVLTGDWLDADGEFAGAGISTDGGDNYDFADWGVDHWSRYSSFFNATHGFVSGGKWPLSAAAHTSILGEPTGFVRPLSDSLSVYIPEDEPAGVVADRLAVNDYQAVIMRTTDGGASWETAFESYGDYYFNQIQFVSESVGFVVGENNRDQNGAILRTTDGGQTWEEVFHTPNSLVAMHMVSETEGWAGGAIFAGVIQAYFVHTTDGGATWTEYQPAEPLPYSIWNYAGEVTDLVYAVAFNQATTALLRYTGGEGMPLAM